MPSPSHDRVDYLDGWRGVAIGALLLGHFVGPFGVGSRLMNAGRLGVELFFALSGTLMGRLLFVKKVPIPSFYRRRVSRIFPALYVFLIGVCIWLSLRERAVSPPGLLSVLLLYYNYYAAVAHRTLPPEYAQIWSLCIEEHAYIALSLVAVVARRTGVRPWLPIAGLVIASWLSAAAYVCFTDWDYYRIFWRTETRLSAVFVAAGLVCWLDETPRPWVSGGWWLAVLGIGISLQAVMVPDIVKYTIGSACLAVAATHLPVAPDWVRRLLGWSGLAWFGVLSYSIYLWQQPFKELRDVASGPTCLAGAVVAGALSFYLLENPVRQWLNKRWGARPLPRDVTDA